MSWQDYVDKNLLGTGQVTKAAIHGHDGTLWAKSPSLTVFHFKFIAHPSHLPNKIQISAKEIEAMMKGFTDPKDIQQHGLKANGITYIVLRSTDSSIYAKRVR